MEFFRRYTRIIASTFLIVVLVSVGLFALQFRTLYFHEINILQNRFVESTINLDSILKSTTDQIDALQGVAEAELDLNQQEPPSQLFYNLIRENSPQSGFYNLQPNPDVQQKGSWGRLMGRSPLNRRSPQLRRELDMALHLYALFKATLQNIPSVAWAYYTSKQAFMSIYPPSEDWIYEDVMLDLDFYKLGLPENNPNRERFWTNAYIDTAGKGLMVTNAAPVYEDDEFKGTVSLDLTLNELNTFVKSFSYAQGSLFIVGQDNQLLAHPTLVSSAEQSVELATEAFPAELRPHVGQIFQAAPMAIQSVGSYLVLYQNMKYAPWRLVFWVPQSTIVFSLLGETILGSIVPLLGVGLMLAIATWLIQRDFIAPAQGLVNYIQAENQNLAPTLPTVPEAWHPWFLTISTIFQQNRKLLQELEAKIVALQSAQLQLVQSEKMSALGNLVSGVAHEINNPVGFIAGNLKPAQDYIVSLFELIDLYQTRLPHLDPELKNFLEDMDLAYVRQDLPKLLTSMTLGVERICEISTSLRTFSRADKDTTTNFDIHAGIDSTLLILKHRLKANHRHPKIKIIKEYGLLPEVNCFPGQLNQVFMNILANAIDALEEANQEQSFDSLHTNPNCITIQTTLEEDGWVAICITDTGLGMPEAVRQHVFDHLFTTKAVGKGTGLGLAIAHQIVTQTHGGSLSCRAALSGGAEFVIRLPVGAAKQESKALPV